MKWITVLPLIFAISVFGACSSGQDVPPTSSGSSTYRDNSVSNVTEVNTADRQRFIESTVTFGEEIIQTEVRLNQQYFLIIDGPIPSTWDWERITLEYRNYARDTLNLRYDNLARATAITGPINDIPASQLWDSHIVLFRRQVSIAEDMVLLVNSERWSDSLSSASLLASVSSEYDNLLLKHAALKSEMARLAQLWYELD